MKLSHPKGGDVFVDWKKELQQSSQVGTVLIRPCFRLCEADRIATDTSAEIAIKPCHSIVSDLTISDEFNIAK